MSHYYTYNVVLALITEVQWWESVSTPELRTSTLNKAHPKKTRREKFVGAANQPECEKKINGYDRAESRMVCTTLSLG